MNAAPALRITDPYATLSSEALTFFRGENEGGMGKWTYFDDSWNALIQNNPYYYLHEKGILLIAENGEQIADQLADMRTLCEIGPGAPSTIDSKTVPLVRAMQTRGLQEYRAIDGSMHAAQASSALVRRRTNINVSSVADDVSSEFGIQAQHKPKAIMILGSTIASLPGGMGVDDEGTDGREELTKTFRRYAANLETPEDRLVFDWDNERRREKLDPAYIGIHNAKLCRSFLRLIQKRCAIQGDFDPHVWHHDAVWLHEKSQMAHIVSPERDQSFTLDEVKVEIEAGKRFVMNNSYKFDADTIEECRYKAGLDGVVSAKNNSNNSMALAIAYKR